MGFYNISSINSKINSSLYKKTSRKLVFWIKVAKIKSCRHTKRIMYAQQNCGGIKFWYSAVNCHGVIISINCLICKNKNSPRLIIFILVWFLFYIFRIIEVKFVRYYSERKSFRYLSIVKFYNILSDFFIWWRFKRYCFWKVTIWWNFQIVCHKYHSIWIIDTHCNYRHTHFLNSSWNKKGVTIIVFILI